MVGRVLRGIKANGVNVLMSVIPICVAVFALMAHDGGWGFWSRDFVLSWGANHGPLSLGPEPWRMFTSMFIHLSVTHLVVNMFALYSMSLLLRHELSPGRMLGFYVACGVLASLTSAFINPNAVMAGASGAIFGIFGALLVMWRRGHPGISGKGLLIDGAMNVCITFFMPVDWVAHLGGFVAGGLLYPLFAGPASQAMARYRRWEEEDLYQ